MENLKTEVEATSTVEDAVPAVSVGASLRRAREAAGISREDLAKGLKLGVGQLTALESDDWDRLPGHTFVRGFVRNYAKQVNLDAAPLMQQLESLIKPPVSVLHLPEATQAQISYSPTAGRDRAVMLVGGGLVLVAALLYFLIPNDLQSWRDSLQEFVDSLARKEEVVTSPAPANESVFPPGTTPQQVMTPQALIAPEQAATAEAKAEPVPAANESRPAPAAAPTETKTAPVAAATGQATLEFKADKSAWIEVKDRDGRTLFSQRMVAGSTQSVSGEGPLSLVIGYAPGVRLSWRGQAVDLEPHTRGDVARLVLE